MVGIAECEEIGQLRDTVAREEAGEQDVRVRQVELPAPCVIELGSQFEPASPLIVEDGGEYAWAVEARPAQEVYGAIESHEGHGTEVTYDAMIFDRLAHQPRL